MEEAQMIKLKKKEKMTEAITIRVTKSLLEKYDKISLSHNYSRNELINQAMKYWLEKIEDTESEDIDE